MDVGRTPAWASKGQGLDLGEIGTDANRFSDVLEWLWIRGLQVVATLVEPGLPKRNFLL